MQMNFTLDRRLLSVILVSLVAGSSCRSAGQTFQVIYSFTHQSSLAGTNSDGARPQALISSDDNLYGVATYGGSGGGGTVFKVTTGGTGFATIHAFPPISDLPPALNTDGARPSSRLLLSGGWLYGTAYAGGISGGGTVFRVSTNGSGFQVLHYFTAAPLTSPTNQDGFGPLAGLVSSANTLYGTTSSGGALGGGTVYSISNDGTGFRVVHDLDYGTASGSVFLSNNVLYGTTLFGGSSNSGSVFAVGTDGAGFTIVHNFTGGADGSQPRGGVVLSSNLLFGTTSYGGVSNNGTVFRVNTDGTSFFVLHSFSKADGDDVIGTLLLSGTRLYGTTTSGGSSGSGTAFSLNIDGTDFITLYSFTGASDGSQPGGGLLLSANRLFGAATTGGDANSGTVFSLIFAPNLSITSVGNRAILTWPTNFSGFDYTTYALQLSTNLASSVWAPVAEPQVVVNGQNTVTNPISNPYAFFRLSR